MASTAKKPLKNATFRVPKSVWQRAKKRAIDEDRSLNDVVVRALESFAGSDTPSGEPPLTEFLRLARAVSAKQAKDGPASRSPSKDELHERRR